MTTQQANQASKRIRKLTDAIATLNDMGRHNKAQLFDAVSTAGAIAHEAGWLPKGFKVLKSAKKADTLAMGRKLQTALLRRAKSISLTVEKLGDDGYAVRAPKAPQPQPTIPLAPKAQAKAEAQAADIVSGLTYTRLVMRGYEENMQRDTMLRHARSAHERQLALMGKAATVAKSWSRLKLRDWARTADAEMRAYAKRHTLRTCEACGGVDHTTESCPKRDQAVAEKASGKAPKANTPARMAFDCALEGVRPKAGLWLVRIDNGHVYGQVTRVTRKAVVYRSDAHGGAEFDLTPEKLATSDHVRCWLTDEQRDTLRAKLGKAATRASSAHTDSLVPSKAKAPKVQAQALFEDTGAEPQGDDDFYGTPSTPEQVQAQAAQVANAKVMSLQEELEALRAENAALRAGAPKVRTTDQSDKARAKRTAKPKAPKADAVTDGQAPKSDWGTVACLANLRCGAPTVGEFRGRRKEIADAIVKEMGSWTDASINDMVEALAEHPKVVVPENRLYAEVRFVMLSLCAQGQMVRVENEGGRSRGHRYSMTGKATRSDDTF